MDLTIAGVVAAGVLAVLWMLLRGSVGRVSTPLSKEQLEALEGAIELLADDSITIQKVVELVFMDTPGARDVASNHGQRASDRDS